MSNDHDLSMALEKQGIHVSDINVVDDTAVARYIKHLAKAEGRIDHVFHTAGHHSFAALELHDGTDGRFQFEVNLFGAMNVLREVAMIMRSQNFGSFTLFSPGPVPKPHPFAGWHNACEAAISSMMTSARLELGQFGMRINHVHWGLQSSLGRDLAPSYIDHIGHAHAYEESVEQAEQGIDRLVEGGRNIDHSVALGVQLATGDQFHGAQSRWRAKIGAAQTVLARYGLRRFSEVIRMLPINKKRQYFVPLIVIEYWLREDVQDGTAFLRQHGINLRGRNLQAYFDITVGFDEWCGLVEGTLNAPGFAEGFSRNLANGYMLTLLPRWHVIGYYNTIGDAFKYIAYYFEISSVVPMRLREAGNSLRLEFSATQLGDGVRRHNFLRMMTMRQVVLNSLVSPIPIRVATSVKPTDAAMFVDVFSYTPEFCDQDYIEIDRANADHLFVFANERTRSLLMQLVKQCDYQARLSSDISETVLAVIENRLGHAAVSVDAIADDLGIGVRTLQRRLQSKGVRFASLLDVARQNMHQTLLAEGRQSAGQIAAALGYHDTNSFYRARSRWRSDAAE